MKKTKVTLLSILGVAILTTGLYSCNNDDVLEQENSTEKQYAAKGEGEVSDFESFFREQREIALKDFSEALVKSMAESMELRNLIKTEALKKFNNDTEVLISQLAELRLSEGTVASKLNQHLQGTTIEQILNIVPTLTVLVPELPENSFSAERWETNTQLPMVAIRTTLSNDNPVINWSETGQIETGVIPSDIIPGSPILVTKVNERVISNLESDFGTSEAREFHTSMFTGISYRYADVAFDGIKFPIKYLPVPSNIDSKLAEAYELTKNNVDGTWQRDHIYYDINPSKQNGPFNYQYKEYLGFIAPKEYNGSAEGAYSAFADQTDPRYNPVKEDGNWNDWTDGSYEMVFNFLLNAGDGSNAGLQTIPKNLPIKPTDLFTLEYDHYTTGTWFWTKNHYKIRSVKAKKYYADLEAFSWNLENFSTSVKVMVSEKDPEQKVTMSVSHSSKTATNFGLDIGVDGILKIAKLGLKFGITSEKNNSQTHQVETTLSSDDLGSSIIDFGEPVVVAKSPIHPFNINLYSLNSYSTGTIDFSLTPKRVQQ